MAFFLPPLRPPAAQRETTFLALCVRCGQCVAVCPYKTLRLSTSFGRSHKTPVLDPEKIPCYLCMKCPPACPTGALDASITDLARVRMGQAYIRTNDCYNFTKGTMCMTCYDRCPLRGKAIVLANGLNPVTTTACAGCGVCVYVCPAKAITLVPAASAYIPPFAVTPISEPNTGGDA